MADRTASPSEPLSRYSAKRNFARTPEPRGVRARKAKAPRLRHAEALGLPTALRLSPGAGRRPAELAGAQGAELRSAGKAHGRSTSRTTRFPTAALKARSLPSSTVPEPSSSGTVAPGNRSAIRARAWPRASCCSSWTARSWLACGNWCVSPSQATSRNPGFSSRSATPSRGRWPSTT